MWKDTEYYWRSAFEAANKVQHMDLRYWFAIHYFSPTFVQIFSKRWKSKIVSNRLSKSFIENVVESQLEVPCWLISKNHCLLWIWKVPWMYQIHIHFRKLEMNGFTRRVYEKRSRLRYLVPNSSMILNSAYDTMPHWPVHLNDLG